MNLDDLDSPVIAWIPPHPRDIQSDRSFSLCFAVLDDGHSCPPSPAPPPGTPTTFPLFSQLPPELRLKIWSHCLAPRIVLATVAEDAHLNGRKPHSVPSELFARTLTYCGSPSFSTTTATTASSSAYSYRKKPYHTPPLLHATSESRAFAQRYYSLSLSTTWRAPRVLASLPPRVPPSPVYFDFERDALMLVGDLEPYAPAEGTSAPAAYFFDRAQARCVRNVCVAFRSLGIESREAEDVATVVFHVVDRFCQGYEQGENGGGKVRSAEENGGKWKANQERRRLIVVVEEGDEDVLAPARRGRVRAARFESEAEAQSREMEEDRGAGIDLSGTGTENPHGKDVGSEGDAQKRVDGWRRKKRAGNDNVVSKIWKACMSGVGDGMSSLEIDMVEIEELSQRLKER